MPDRTESWQEDTGTAIVRYAEDSYAPGQTTAKLRETWAPHKLRLDEAPEKLMAGAKYTVMYRETHKDMPASPLGRTTTQDRMEVWTVQSINDSVTVGGTVIPNCLKINRVGTDAGAMSNKTFWYARGVGKVKELGNQLEELTAVEGL
jgi:hypothetical protein